MSERIPNAGVGLALGTAVMLLVGVGAGLGTQTAVKRWDRWGPLGPSSPVPEFKAKRMHGGALTHRDLQKGKPSLLTFWATWCGPCKAEMPVIDTLASKFEDDGLLVYGVNRDDDPYQFELVQEYQHSMGLDFEQVLDTDGSVGRAFRVSGVPHVVLVDREGIVRYVHEGRVSQGTLEDEIETLLDE